MNQQETLALYNKGANSWNAWAQEMLRKRDDIEKYRFWETDCLYYGSEEPKNQETCHWFNCALADFSGVFFNEDADFNLCFPGTVIFDRATFRKRVVFSRARFFGPACFKSVKFEGYAAFKEAGFSRHANFDDVIFNGDAEFDKAVFGAHVSFAGATFNGRGGFWCAKFISDAGFWASQFNGDASFSMATFDGHTGFRGAAFNCRATFIQARFRGYAEFVRARFGGTAEFSAVSAESAFLLTDARFGEVPDFTQAHFAEAPLLDDLSVASKFSKTNDIAARFRALKRLAIQGHDHIREKEYFAGELKSLRGNPDRLLPCLLNLFQKDADGKRPAVWPGGARYILGLFYQIFSDFGRSAVRPIVSLVLAFIICAWLYFREHFARAAEVGTAYNVSASGWFVSKLNELSSSSAAPAPLTCIVGPGEPLSAAVGLSLRKALPFASVASSEKLNQIYACLYGMNAQNPTRYTPIIPDFIDIIGIFQIIFSLICIFLFALAVRNTFRIS